MTWATKRKAMYITGISLVFIGVIVFFAWPRVASTCSDGLQGEDETGVDCGGVCARVCASDVKELRVRWTRVFEISTGKMLIVSYIENPNQEFALLDMPYSIDVYNNSGLLDTINGIIAVGPNSSTAVTNIYITPDTSIRPTFSWASDVYEWRRVNEKVNSDNVKVLYKDMSDEDMFPYLQVGLQNETPKLLESLNVIALVYDFEGNVIRAGSMMVDSLKVNETTKVAFSWKKPIEEKIKNIEIITNVNPFSARF